ncbi:ERF family protein [Verrucomicrobium sp. BvORR106]|uniref:ERF family protein n=1 Tax=Verrucomicrobium sp. BvORR106 TaxID=1403819 RepID=UPI00068D7968|nr:ERF family protein [Verrucomicrobium sp. BvORR106]
MEHSPQLDQLAAALAKAQAAGLVAVKGSTNTHLKADYADILAVWECIRPQLAAHGLAFSQFPGAVREVERGLPRLSVTNMLLHESGQFISGIMEMPVGDHKGLNAAQCFGLVLTYARRYGLLAVLGVATGDDEDAQRAFPKEREPEPPTNKTWQEIYEASEWQKREAPGDDAWRELGQLTPAELWEHIKNNKANGYGNLVLVAACAHVLDYQARLRNLGVREALITAKWQGKQMYGEMTAEELFAACKVVSALPKLEPKGGAEG